MRLLPKSTPVIPHKVNDCDVYLGSATAILKKLPSQTIHTCITSPPYYGLRDYGITGQLGLQESPQEYVDDLVTVFREVRRVLRDDGTLWLNLGDTYAANRPYQCHSTKGGAKHGPGQAAGGRRSVVPQGLKPKDLIGIPWRVAFALQEDGWYLRQDIIWHKPNVMPESVKDRCTKSHEYIFLFSKSQKYYFDCESIKEPAVSPGKFNGSLSGSKSGANGDRNDGGRGRIPGDGFRNRRSVWSVNTRPYKEAHFAVYPPDLIRPCILAGAPPEGFVLDPFLGSGTTLATAIEEGRKGVGVELNPQYLPLIISRLSETSIGMKGKS